MRLEPTRSSGHGNRGFREIRAQKMKMLPSEDSNPAARERRVGHGGVALHQPALLRNAGQAPLAPEPMPPPNPETRLVVSIPEISEAFGAPEYVRLT